MEGGLDTNLAQEIFAGRRRPRGHLLPQTLCAHAGLFEATRLRFARIVRIAVHPAAQGRGLGRSLINGILRDDWTADADLVGASFGATLDLLDFWRHCNFTPVHIGTARNAATGAHAAVVLRSRTTDGARLKDAAEKRLGERLNVLLAGPLRDIEPGIAASLLAAVPAADHEPNADERAEIESFAFGLRPYESALPPLTRLLASRLGKVQAGGMLEDRERDALIGTILQHRDWSTVAEMTGVTGRAAVVSLLRRATGKLLV
jgi:tRNA(Met) cytidine acetyltransferase